MLEPAPPQQRGEREPVGGRRPGTRSRRVVAGPTGAPGDASEALLPRGAVGERADREAEGLGAASAWEAEAERLRRDRPPHWG